MHLKKFVITLGLFSLLGAAAAQAQLYQINIHGTCATTNASGKMVIKQLNNQTLLADYARMGGLASAAGLALAYHVGGNALGDTIDVINTNTKGTVGTLYGLYFGEDFGRASVTNNAATQVRRLEYVYTYQNSHSIGSCYITAYPRSDRTYIYGNMQWVVAQDYFYTAPQVCSASFSTGPQY